VVVPSLPIISDPGLFLLFYDSVIEQSKSTTQSYRHFLVRGDSTLRYHSFNIIDSLFSSVGSHQNFDDETFPLPTGSTGAFALPPTSQEAGPARLISSLLADWTSNENWSRLSLAYGLSAYVIHLVKPWKHKFLAESSSRQGSNKKAKRETQKSNEERSKFDANLWEAWWGLLFFERQLWNESTKDLEVTLEFLIKRKYAPLIYELSSGFRNYFGVHRGSICATFRKQILAQQKVQLARTAEQTTGRAATGRAAGISTKSSVDTSQEGRPNSQYLHVKHEEVFDDDLILKNLDFSVETDQDTIMPKKKDQKKEAVFLGYRAFIPDTKFSAFNYTSWNRAVESVLFLENSWHDDTGNDNTRQHDIPVISKRMGSIKALSSTLTRQHLEIPAMVQRVREAGAIRQNIWDILLDEIQNTGRGGPYIYKLQAPNFSSIRSQLVKLMPPLCNKLEERQVSLDSEKWKEVMVLCWAEVFLPFTLLNNSFISLQSCMVLR